MSNQTNPSTEPDKTLKVKIYVDFYDAMRRLFDAPIIFLTGFAMIPGAFASWLGKDTSTKNVGISPFTFFGGLLVASLILFQAEAKITLRYFLFQKGVLVNPQTQRLLEDGCRASGGIVIPSGQPAPESTTITLLANKCQTSNF